MRINFQSKYFTEFSKDVQKRLRRLSFPANDGSMIKDVLRDNKEHCYCIVAFHPDDVKKQYPIGWVVISYEEYWFQKKPNWFDLNFFVQKRHRRKGIATKLADRAMRYVAHVKKDNEKWKFYGHDCAGKRLESLVEKSAKKYNCKKYRY